MYILGLLFSLVLLANCVLRTTADHWGYPPEADNGVITGSVSWGGDCSIGRRQSPIDLAKAASVTGRYPPLFFRNYDSVLENAKIRNTGHSLQIDVPINQEYLFTGGALPGIYRMDQMHFHWASEHTVDSRRFGLELHIVSHNQQYKNFTEALKHKQGVAVLGVLFHISADINPLLKNILDSAEAVKDEVGESNAIKAPFSPLQLLPIDQSAYFRYEGSLTTPNCNEAVIWTVLEQSVPFAASQIERFKQVKDSTGELLTHNFRPLQRLNSRPLVYVRDDGDHSAATTIQLPIILLAAIFIFHFVHINKL